MRTPGRSPRARQPWGRRQVLFLTCVVVLGCLLYMSQYVGPAGEIRTQKLALIRSEFARITLFSGSTALTEQARDEAFVPPQIERRYSLPGGQCVNEQNYYQVELALDGWSPPLATPGFVSNPGVVNVGQGSGSDDRDANWVTATYLKRRQGHTLRLDVDCAVDQSLLPGYQMYMEAN